MQVVVVGGGIMGLSTAWGLRRLGCKVTVLEQNRVPNPLGSSGDQHRLIRYAYGAELGYTRLIRPAYAAWDLLWQALGVSHHHPTGTLVMAKDDLLWAEASMKTLARAGHTVERMSSTQLKAAYPHLQTEDLELSYYLPSGGVLMAENILTDLAKKLRLTGTEILEHAHVIEVNPAKNTVVLQDGTRMQADLVVVAAGPWTSRLLPSLEADVTPSRQVVLYMKPPPQMQTAWKHSPMMLDIGGCGGVYAVPPRAGAGLKVGDHSFSLSGDPDEDRIPRAQEVQDLFEACRSRLKDLDQYTIDHAKTCFYTVQPTEHFIVDKIDRAWVMTGFSGHGFKFGALMGLLTAQAAMGSISPSDMRRIAAGQVVNTNDLAMLTDPCLDQTSGGLSL